MCMLNNRISSKFQVLNTFVRFKALWTPDYSRIHLRNTQLLLSKLNLRFSETKHTTRSKCLWHKSTVLTWTTHKEVDDKLNRWHVNLSIQKYYPCNYNWVIFNKATGARKPVKVLSASWCHSQKLKIEIRKNQKHGFIAREKWMLVSSYSFFITLQIFE